MAVTQNQYTGNGSTVLFSFTFPYLASTDVKVKVDGTDTTAFTLANATTVQMNAAPANGAVVIVYRNTDNDNKKATFYPGSAIKAEDLNNDFDQILYVAQEVDNNALNSLGTSPMQGNLSMGNNKLTNLATPTAGTDAANKTYVDTQSSAAIDSALAAGTDLSKATSSGVTTFAHNVSGANQTINNSNGTVLQDITISAQGHVTSAGSTDLDNRYYTKTTLDGGHFDSRYYTETELNAGQLNNQYYTETELDAGQLDNRYYTETELNAGQLDNRYYTEAELNAGQLDTRYFRQDSSETISQGDTWSGSDNYIATTAAIDARITDLVEEVGGFVPIANETSFPTSNPDINNGAGTLISIKAMSSSRTPSGGVVTISDGAGSGVTVTINGCGTTVLTAGYGVILETTSTTHTYNFHRLSPSTLSITTVSNNISNINAVAANETNINAVNNNSTNINAVANNNSNITAVAGNATNINAVAPNVSNISAVNSNATNINTVADNNSNINTVAGAASNISTVATNISSVNNFADRYRVASSAPSSSLDVGDLYFDTTGNELKVYNGSAWQGGVTATGNLVSKSGDQFTGNITFSGSQTVDGRDLSVDGTKLDTIATNANNYAISSDLLDQDDMVSNSATKVPSQQSVKAYVDNQTLSLIDEDDMATDSATRPPSQQSVKAYADTKAPKASPAFTGTATGVNLTLSGDLTVNGTTTTLNSTTVSIDDKNLELGKVATPTDTTADGGGITLKGGTDKTFNWVNSTDAWTSSEHIHLPDDKKLKFGSELEIYSTSNASYIKDTGTGNLTFDVDNLIINNAADSATIAKFKEGDAVELYYNGSKKFETSANGVVIQGLDTVTSVGSPAALQLEGGDADGEYVNLRLTTAAGGTLGNISAKAVTTGNYPNSVGELIFSIQNASATYEALKITSNRDINIPTDGKKLQLGASQDLQLNHDGNHSYINHDGTGSLYLQSSGGFYLQKYGTTERLINANNDGSVELFHNGIKTFETDASGVKISGPEGDAAHLYMFADEGDDDADKWALLASAGGTFQIRNRSTGSWVDSLTVDSSGKVGIGTTSPQVALEIKGINDGGDISLLNLRNHGGDGSNVLLNFISSTDAANTAARSYIKSSRSGSSSSLAFATSNTTALTLDSSQNATFAGELQVNNGKITVQGAEGNSGILQIFSDEGDDNADKWRLLKSSGNNDLVIQNYGSGSWATNVTFDQNEGATFGGTVSDSKGNLRSIPQNAKTANYTLVAADAGKHILCNTASITITYNPNTFDNGDAITVVNNTTGDINIHNSAGTNMQSTLGNGNRVLASRGMATILTVDDAANGTGYISGAGLS